MNLLTILQGDAIEKLRELPDESAQCCVTSPPYWGLRDYGTASWEGGEADCDHKQGRNGSWRADGVVEMVGQRNRDGVGGMIGSTCRKCGASRIDSQIGLEETPDQYVAKMAEVFREVRRVLRDDGTLWLNLGDSYATGTTSDRKPTQTGKHGYWENPAINKRINGKEFGLKPKDLVGIPWRVAFALQADGWYLRSDIIWSKPNPMPESVTDRPTKAHEYLFLLSKNERYFYDAEAIREPHEMGPNSHFWGTKAQPIGGLKDSDGMSRLSLPTRAGGREYNLAGRNKRSVWTVPTFSYPEAHFATYPPDLIKPCILAGTKAGDAVLDPFAGSGTTGEVAIELGRKALMIELNPDYIPLIELRCSITPGLPL